MEKIIEIVQTFNVRLALKNIFSKINEIIKNVNGITPYEPTYKVYTALLTQSGTASPVATVLENTLGGEVVWTYDDIGSWIATNPLFSSTNTIGTAMGTNGSNIVIVDAENYGIQNVGLWQYQPEISSNVNNFDGWIEIRVYN